MSFSRKIILLFMLCFAVGNSVAQNSGNAYAFPVTIKTFYAISNGTVQGPDANSLFTLFTQSLDSVFNFGQKITQFGSKVKVELYDSALLFNDIKIDTIVKTNRMGSLSWGEPDEYRRLNPSSNTDCIERYCNIIRPKIEYILSKYKINVSCDYFLANFLISLACPTCWVFNEDDYHRFFYDSADLKFFKFKNTQSVIYQEVTVSDSIKIVPGARIIKAEGIPAQLLPYAMLQDLILTRKDTTTKLQILQNKRLIECEYRFKKDTLREFDYKLLNDTVALLKINSFTEGFTGSVKEQLLKDSLAIKKIIIDVRQCVGGGLKEAISFCDLFLDAGHVIGEQSAFTFYDKNDRSYFSQPGELFSYVPVFILTGSATSSGAEIIAGALKEYKRAVLIGQATAGQGEIKQTRLLLPGYYIALYISDFTTAKKYKLGIDRVWPNEYCIPESTVDNVLERALKK